jgi:hypothetical protein
MENKGEGGGGKGGGGRECQGEGEQTVLPIKKNELDPSKMTDAEIEAASGDLLNVANMIAFGSGMSSLEEEAEVEWKEVSIQEYVDHSYKEIEEQLSALQEGRKPQSLTYQGQAGSVKNGADREVDECKDEEEELCRAEGKEQEVSSDNKAERLRLTAKQNYDNLQNLLKLDIEEDILDKDQLAKQLHVEQQLSTEMQQMRERKNEKLKQRLEARRRQRSSAEPPEAPALTA